MLWINVLAKDKDEAQARSCLELPHKIDTWNLEIFLDLEIKLEPEKRYLKEVCFSLL